LEVVERSILVKLLQTIWNKYTAYTHWFVDIIIGFDSCLSPYLPRGIFPSSWKNYQFDIQAITLFARNLLESIHIILTCIENTFFVYMFIFFLLF
jgi:SMC interacting uncharacterized protein involved in chromosome segregation